MNVPATPAHAPEAHGARELRIMLVEDSAVLAEHLRELIAGLPHMQLLGVADTQSAALAMLADLYPEVLILDLHLREGSGFGVLRAMARMEPPPKVIVLTTYGLPEYRREALKLGVSAFLDKACDYHLLPGILRDWAGRAGGRPAA
jgi:DNA-binding NarL/FixJ family response regulator